MARYTVDTLTVHRLLGNEWAEKVLACGMSSVRRRIGDFLCVVRTYLACFCRLHTSLLYKSIRWSRSFLYSYWWM